MKVRIKFENPFEELEYDLTGKFSTLKHKTELLSYSFRRLGQEKRSKRVYFCAREMAFGSDYDETVDCSVSDSAGFGDFDLQEAHFCRERLCPMCQSRRAKKAFNQIATITQTLEQQGMRFLFLTLTIPNCSGSDLRLTIMRMQKAFHRFVNYKRFTSAVKGFFRSLEVTRNNYKECKGKPNPFYGTFHPHFHILLAVDADYFTSGKYLDNKTYYLLDTDLDAHKDKVHFRRKRTGNFERVSNDVVYKDDESKKKEWYIVDEKRGQEWLKLWRRAYRDDTITQVDVRVVKDRDSQEESKEMKLSRACAEIAKYTMKSKDYIFPNDDDLTDEVVATLQSALKGVRLIALGGVMKELAQRLELDDVEDGDLIHIEVKPKPKHGACLFMCRYAWNYQQHHYDLVSEEFEFKISGVGWVSARVCIDAGFMDSSGSGLKDLEKIENSPYYHSLQLERRKNF